MNSLQNPTWIKELLEELDSLEKDKNENLKQEDLEKLIRKFAATVGAYSSIEKREKIYTEVNEILRQVSDLKHETFIMGEEVLRESIVPDISIELKSVITQTEKSVEGILDISDALQSLSQQEIPNDLKEILCAHSTRLLELCNFQDLTGQIIHKIIKNLSDIESTIGNIFNILSQDQRLTLKEKESPAPQKDKLLNGPQKDEDRPSQTDVDNLFDSL